MFLFIFRDVSQFLSEYRQFVSAKLRLAAVNCRVRFVRFECYKKYLQESNGFDDFFKVSNKHCNLIKYLCKKVLFPKFALVRFVRFRYYSYVGRKIFLISKRSGKFW